MKNFSVPAGETGKTIYQKTKFHDMHYTYDTPPGDPTASRIFFKFTNQRQLEFVSQRNRLSPRGRGGSLFFFPAEAGWLRFWMWGQYIMGRYWQFVVCFTLLCRKMLSHFWLISTKTSGRMMNALRNCLQTLLQFLRKREEMGRRRSAGQIPLWPVPLPHTKNPNPPPLWPSCPGRIR